MRSSGTGTTLATTVAVPRLSKVVVRPLSCSPLRTADRLTSHADSTTVAGACGSRSRS